MERPSHIAFNNRHFSHRLPFLGLAVCLQVSVAWILSHELINHRIGDILPGTLEVSPIPDEKPHPPLPPPPDPTLATPSHLTAVEPIFDTAPGERTMVNVEPRQSTNFVPSQPPPGVDRAPVSVAATHTTPPYPPIARRIGAEGKVTLRLTVSTEGRVSAAEVVNTSGRDELDQAAQQWILAHWSYKPALAAGVPVASKVLATVTFSLTNER
jgi:protein TonB